MAISVDTLRERRAFRHRLGRRPAVAGASAPFGPTLALTVTLAVACFAVAVGCVELIVNPEPLPPPFDLGQNQTIETGLYLMGFALILPLALIVVPRLADTIAAGHSGGALSSLAALLVATLAASVLVARLLPGGGGAELLGTVAIWSVGAVALLARAWQPRPFTRPSHAASLAPVLWALAGVLVLVALLAFFSVRSISPLPLALGAVAATAVLIVYLRAGASGRAREPRWGGAIDAGIVALVVLAVTDLVVFSRESGLAAFQASVAKSHQDFLLGPTNEVLHGGAVLVDAASQYGIGPIYLLAGWFQIAPIGYGTIGLLDGLLFGLVFAAGYCLLRLSGTSRLLAAASLVLAVVVLAYNLLYSVGSLPNHGPIRFGLPVILILAAAVEARWPHRSGAARATQLVVVGLSSVWSLEAFAYTVATFAGLICFQAFTRPAPGRLAWLARRAALGLAACGATHVLFVAGTLAAVGELPDYGWYLAFLEAFLFDEVGDITYDFSRWSPGLAVGAGYAASAAALVLLLRRRSELVDRERVTLIALAGTTAYGIALFSYFVDRSNNEILPYVSMPLLLAGTLWLSLLLRGALGGSRNARAGGLAFALSLALLLFATAWSSVDERFPRSALGHLVPGGDSARPALDRLWDLPPIDGRAPQGETPARPLHARGSPRADTHMAGSRDRDPDPKRACARAAADLSSRRTAS